MTVQLTARSRNRNRDISLDLNGAILQKVRTGDPIVRNALSGFCYTQREEMSDFVTPKYWHKLRTGEMLPVNNMTQLKTGVELATPATSMGWHHYNPNYSWSGYIWQGHQALYKLHQLFWNDDVNGWDYPPMPECSERNEGMRTKQSLIQEALASVNTRSWDLGTFGAEFNKTLDLIIGFRKRFVKRARRIRKRYPKASVREFADEWMEHRYGWRILKYDVEDIFGAFKRLRDGTGEWARYTTFNGGGVTLTESDYSNSAANLATGCTGEIASLSGPFAHVRNVKHRCTFEQRAGVGVELFLRDIAFIDPLVTVYEIIPYSFVADWFWNLGDAIAAFSPFAGTKVLWGWYSVRRRSVYELTITPASGNIYLLDDGCQPSRADLYSETYHRTKEEPTFDFSFELNFDINKMRDLLSMISNGGKNPHLPTRR